MKLIRTPVKDQVYQIIKDRILAEEFALGEKVNMLTLSKELGVSNTPIREALSMLERDGLVQMVSNAGPRVFEYSEERFEQIEDSMEALLIGSYEVAYAAGKSAKLAEMMKEALGKQTEMHKTMERHEYARISMEFDACFVRINENEYLNGLYDQLNDLFYLVVLYEHNLEEGDRLPVIEEHRKIMEAVQAEEHDKVISLLKEHYSRM